VPQAFEDDLPFEHFSLRVAEANIADLPRTLKGMIENQPARIASMQVSAPAGRALLTLVEPAAGCVE
jgi:hypothetical protein